MLKYESKKISADFIGETWTKIKLYLEGVNPGIANGLRRICLLDLEKTALIMDIESLQSDDTEIRKLFSDIKINISLIRTTLPEDIELIISEKNVANEPKIITSNDFKHSEGTDKKYDLRKHIQQDIQICSLARNCSIKLTVRTEKKSGFYGPQFIPTRDIGYKVTDYVDVDLINYSGNIEEAMVERKAVEELIKSKDLHYSSGTKKQREIYDKKILICPDKLYLDKMEKEAKNNLDEFYSYYDYVVINNATNDGIIPDTLFSNNYVQKISSTEAMPEDFRLIFRIYYDVNPEEFLKSIFDKYVQKLQSLLDVPNKIVTEVVKIDHSGTIYTLRKNLIYDENETVANILRYQIFDMVPEIPFINMEKPHKIDNMIYLNFISESEDLLEKAIKNTIQNLEKLKSKI
jgi:DNA-directed RNA polymerase subunit L